MVIVSSLVQVDLNAEFYAKIYIFAMAQRHTFKKFFAQMSIYDHLLSDVRPFICLSASKVFKHITSPPETLGQMKKKKIIKMVWNTSML